MQTAGEGACQACQPPQMASVPSTTRTALPPMRTVSRRPPSTIQRKHDGARAPHLVALLDHPPMRAVGQPVEVVHDARQADGRRSGRRILGDAELRREHARVEGGVVVHALARIEIDAVDLVVREGRSPMGGADARLGRWPRGCSRGRRRTCCRRPGTRRCGSRSRSRAAAAPAHRRGGRARLACLSSPAASARRTRRTAPDRRADAHRRARCRSPAPAR